MIEDDVDKVCASLTNSDVFEFNLYVTIILNE